MFRGEKWDIVHLCRSNITRDMIKNLKNWFFQKCNFCAIFLQLCNLSLCWKNSRKIDWKWYFICTQRPKSTHFPQIRPIENFFGLLKQRVYQGNCSAHSREQLIRRIKKCISEMDMDIVIKMFDNLEVKIQQAHEYGLDSLL